MEKAMTIEKAAGAFGYPETFVREACMRAADMHPLPCIKRGGKRPQCYIRAETFERWLGEEELIQAGVWTGSTGEGGEALPMTA